MTNSINMISEHDVQLFLDHASHFNAPGNTMNLYQQIATQNASYPGRRQGVGLMYVALKMNGEAGEFAEHVGKAARDDNMLADSGPTFLTVARRDQLVKELGDVLWYLCAACNELQISLAQVAHINLVKLKERTAKDSLRGSGDNR